MVKCPNIQNTEYKCKCNLVDATKTYKGEVNYAHIVDLVINLVSAKEAKCKVYQMIGHYAKVYKSKYRKTKQNNDRSNIQFARLTGNKKKSTNMHLVTDDGDILETTHREDILWLHTIDVYPDTQNNAPIYIPNSFLEVYNVHKTKSH